MLQQRPLSHSILPQCSRPAMNKNCRFHLLVSSTLYFRAHMGKENWSKLLATSHAVSSASCRPSKRKSSSFPSHIGVLSKKQIQQIHPLQNDFVRIASTCTLSNKFQMLTKFYFASLFLLKRTKFQCAHLALFTSASQLQIWYLKEKFT